MFISTLKFALKQFGIYIAATVVAIITMSLVMTSQIGIAYKALIGSIFIGFICVLAWNSAADRGEKDYRDHSFLYQGKGFAAGALAMLPLFLLVLFNLLVTFRGWEAGSSLLSEILYLILYFLFIPYCPLLSLLVTNNPALDINFGQLAITTVTNGISIPNAIPAPLFLLPIVVLILVSGFGYLHGLQVQMVMHLAVQKIKEKTGIE